MSIDHEIAEIVVSNVVDEVTEYRREGFTPTGVRMSTETLESVARVQEWRQMFTLGVPSFFGLRLQVDDSLGLGVAKVSASMTLPPKVS